MKNRSSSARSIPSFVEEYGINMEDSLKGMGEFKHFNDFFYRRLKPGARPLAGGEDTAVFPADARHMGWERADRIKSVFVKGQSFDLPPLWGVKRWPDGMRKAPSFCRACAPRITTVFIFRCPGCPARGRGWRSAGERVSVLPAPPAGVAMD